METLTFNVYKIDELPTPQALSQAKNYVLHKLKYDICSFKLIKEKVRLLLNSYGLFIIDDENYTYIPYIEGGYEDEDEYTLRDCSISVNKYLLHNIERTQIEYPKSVQYVTDLNHTIEYRSAIVSIQCEELKDPTYAKHTSFREQEYWRLSCEIGKTIEIVSVCIDELIKQALQERHTTDWLCNYSNEKGYRFFEDGTCYTGHRDLLLT